MRLFLFAICTLLFGCDSESTINENIAMKQEQISTDILSVVKKYLNENKGWGDDDYTVHIVTDGDELKVFEIMHKSDIDSIKVGGGQSVELHYDVKKNKIVRELGYQ